MPQQTTANEGALNLSKTPCVLTHRTIRYRLKPLTKDNAHWLYNCSGAVRHLWNYLLADSQAKYTWHKWGIYPAGDEKSNKKAINPSYMNMTYILPKLKEDKEWLKELPNDILRSAAKRLGLAFKEFLSGKRGYPRFRGKGWGEGFDLVEGTLKITHINGKHHHVTFPNRRKSKMLLVGNNIYEGSKIAKATIKLEQGKWYAYVAYNVSLPVKENNGTAIGIDCNAGQVAASNERIYHLPDVSRLEARKKRYYRMTSRRVKGSARRRVAVAKLAKTAAKITKIKTNWHHHISCQITDLYTMSMWRS